MGKCGGWEDIPSQHENSGKPPKRKFGMGDKGYPPRPQSHCILHRIAFMLIATIHSYPKLSAILDLFDACTLYFWLMYVSTYLSTNAWNFCLIIELSIIGILNYWAIITGTRGKRAAPTTVIEKSIIEQKFQSLVGEEKNAMHLHNIRMSVMVF